MFEILHGFVVFGLAPVVGGHIGDGLYDWRHGGEA